MSESVGIRELRHHFTAYLARVRRGETFTVTDRRQVVAVLGPASRSEDVLARLCAEGRATAARPGPRPEALRLALPERFSQLVSETGADRL